MITRYERRLLLFYASNIAARFPHQSKLATALASWIDEHADLFEIGGRVGERVDSRHQGDGAQEPTGSGANNLPDEIRHLLGMQSGDHLGLDQDGLRLSRKAWESLKDLLARELASARNVRADPMAARIRELSRIAGTSSTDRTILELLLRFETRPPIKSLVDEVGQLDGLRRFGLSMSDRVLPDLLGLTYSACSARLKPGAPLVRSGLVSVEHDGDIELVDRLKRLAYAATDSASSVGQLLFGAAPPSGLLWSDFDHVAEARDHVERLMMGALEANAPGVNVLVYGPPGTGKTQFCRTLADRLGAALHSVGESDDSGGEPSRFERLQELNLAQQVFGSNERTLLLFDEMEDLLTSSTHFDLPFGKRSSRGRRGSEGSKVYMNRLLERNAVPTLWTANSAQRTHPTLLRRMMFAIELRNPSRAVRTRIWARQLARHGIEADQDQAGALAREFDVTPGVAAGATAGAKLVEGGGVEAVRLGVRSLARLMSGDQPPQRAPADFDPNLVHADLDAAALAERLARWGVRRASLCLSGPPGTGKSAFVRYLAERIGIELVQKRASDLLSMWVGETERLIAAAFAEAREDRQFLVFDEADSLLADRRFAHRSWEVSQVNEMLTWMESHPLPFACTTNFSERLDAATLRRFDFKIALGYLTPDQVRTAFRSFFGLVPPAELDESRSLTPGDFAVVRRRAEVLDCLENPSALAGLLREECDAKPDRQGRVGFGG